MKILRILIFLVLVSATLSLGTNSQARNILVDESHDQQWSFFSEGRFSEMRALLGGEGHSLSSLPGVPGAITAGALAGSDVFYTGTLNEGYLAAEITALQDFVTGGGGVICCHDGGWNSDSGVTSINSFLAPYGMVMAASASFGNGVIASDFVEHCLLEGVQSAGFDFLRELTAINAPAIDLTISGVEILAVYEAPAGGWVIVIGDDNQWSNAGTGDYDISSFDNQQLALNVFNFLGCNTPTEESSWSLVKSLY